MTSAASGVLMAIPFFGPFVAWAPPVIVSILIPNGSPLAAFILMGIGWLLVMNLLQPRLMQEAVGIHPIVVLGSVLIGAEIAGIAGAIFGIPIAAVVSAFFFHYLAITRDRHRSRNALPSGSRPGRDARSGSRASQRPGIDPDVTDVTPTDGRRPDRTGTCTTTRRAAPAPPRSDGATAADQPDMTRERARTERRDLDKERGEPVAGGAPRGRPRALRAVAKPLDDWTGRPRILITNDDGVESRGLLALKQALEPIGDTTVVAPDTNQSAVGHQKTLMRPLRVRERTLG